LMPNEDVVCEVGHVGHVVDCNKVIIAHPDPSDEHCATLRSGTMLLNEFVCL
jgi:hypothetical protein